MKLLSFATREQPDLPRIGTLSDGFVIDLEEASTWAQGGQGLPREQLPKTMIELIFAGKSACLYIGNILAALEGQNPGILKGAGRKPVGYPEKQVRIYSPLPRPNSLRDFYAFEAHVAAAFALRNRSIPEEWYQFPVFYFSNPNAVFGTNTIIPYPPATQELDYELEVACIIGKVGINIPAHQALEYIFGYTIFNDWSARDVQRLEMRVGLGPAKGKDFASSLGPWIVTPDEINDFTTDRPGVFDLEMIARVNGIEKSRGNWKDLHYSFAEMIARASQDAYLLPGDVIGSGTVGTGCLLEVTKNKGPWLKPGDIVELEISRIGKIINQIGALPSPDRS